MAKRSDTKSYKAATVQVKSREALAQDSARLEALFASIGEGVIATNENGIITRINQTALDMLGLRRKDAIDQRFLSAIVSVHDNGTPVDVFERPIVKAFQTGKTIHARTLYIRKDNSLLPVQLT